jgi:hypothetical protein
MGRLERVRRGGFSSQAAARRARQEWLTRTGEERTARSWTVQRWLRYWLSTRTSIRPTTLLHYTRDVEVLGRYLGGVCLADLDVRRLRRVFNEIAETTNLDSRCGDLVEALARWHRPGADLVGMRAITRPGMSRHSPMHDHPLPKQVALAALGHLNPIRRRHERVSRTGVTRRKPAA